MLTSEQRLEQNKKFKMEGNILCSVCGKKFENWYSFSNHCYNRVLKRFIDNEHERHFKDIQNIRKQKRHEQQQIKERKKKCIKCHNFFYVDLAHAFQKKCVECHIKFPNKIIKSKKVKNWQEKDKKILCLKCKNEIIVNKFCSHKVCDNCKNEERKQYIEALMKRPIKAECKYCKKEILVKRKTTRTHIPQIVCADCKNKVFLFHPKLDVVLKLVKETCLTRCEIKNLISLEKDYIRQASIYFYGKQWWLDREKQIQLNGSKITGEKRKEFFRQLREKPDELSKYLSYLHRNPSKLEIMFSSSLPEELEKEPNTWLTVKVNDRFEHHEVDLKVKLDYFKKFAIFVDGEAFHGKNAIVSNASIVKDELVAKAFSDLGYYTIRYSESEILSGWANENFYSLFSNFKLCKPLYYYRNWQTNETIRF